MFNSPISLAVSAAFIGAIANTLRLELVDLVNVPPAAAAFIGALTAGILALPLGLILPGFLRIKPFGIARDFKHALYFLSPDFFCDFFY